MDKEQKKNKEMNSKVKRFIFSYYKIVTILVILLLVVGSYYFILQPKYKEISLGGRYDLFNLEQDIILKNEYLSTLQQLNDNYAEIDSQNKVRLERILPKESDIPGLLVQLEALAESEDVLLASLSFKEVPKVAPSTRRSRKRPVEEESSAVMAQLNKVTIDLNLVTNSVTGDYRKVKSFLTAIEHNLRIFDVNSVFYSPGSPNFTISLVTYYLD